MTDIDSFGVGYTLECSSLGSDGSFIESYDCKDEYTFGENIDLIDLVCGYHYASNMPYKDLIAEQARLIIAMGFGSPFSEKVPPIDKNMPPYRFSKENIEKLSNLNELYSYVWWPRDMSLAVIDRQFEKFMYRAFNSIKLKPIIHYDYPIQPTLF